jgi:predicted esterase YcpF (UPF0227 family)
MILYLHGFASCGDSTKTRLLKDYFGDANICAPDLPVPPDDAIAFIDVLIKEKAIDLLIGSSLGGYYAAYFCEKYGIKTVLINPSTEPYITLEPYIGENHFWCSGKPFIWKKEYLESLKRFKTQKIKAPSAYLLLLQKGDEVLDYTKALEKFRGSMLSLEEGGNHRFENLDVYLKTIEGFYGSVSCAFSADYLNRAEVTLKPRPAINTVPKRLSAILAEASR